MKNTRGLHPLHITCFHGYKKFTLELIKLHRIFNISLDLLDDQNNTPINLLSSHGYLEMNLDLLDVNSEDQMRTFNETQKDKFEILQQFFL